MLLNQHDLLTVHSSTLLKYKTTFVQCTQVQLLMCVCVVNRTADIFNVLRYNDKVYFHLCLIAELCVMKDYIVSLYRRQCIRLRLHTWWLIATNFWFSQACRTIVETINTIFYVYKSQSNILDKCRLSHSSQRKISAPALRQPIFCLLQISLIL